MIFSASDVTRLARNELESLIGQPRLKARRIGRASKDELRYRYIEVIPNLPLLVVKCDDEYLGRRLAHSTTAADLLTDGVVDERHVQYDQESLNSHSSMPEWITKVNCPNRM